MAIKKDLKEIKENQNKIIKLLNKNYINKAEELDTVKEYLSDIEVSCTSQKLIDEYGNPFLRVSYKIEPIDIRFDEDSNPVVNKMFKAINYLNLLSLKDMNDLSKEINKIQGRKK